MSLPLTCASLAPYSERSSRNFKCQCRSTKPYVGGECPDCRCAPPQIFGEIKTYSVSFTIRATSATAAVHELIRNLRDREDYARQQELYALLEDGLPDGDGPAILEIDEYGRDERA